MTTRDLTEYKSDIIAVASQADMDDRIMVSHPVRIPVRNFAMVPTKCPNMFSGRVEAHPCPVNSRTNIQICTWNPCNIITPMVSGKRKCPT